MTHKEFEYWLEGFEVSFEDGIPNKEQYAEIKKRLATVTMFPVPSAPPVPLAPYDKKLPYETPTYPSEPWVTYTVSQTTGNA